MPFTVDYSGAGIKRHEFDTYIRLLGKRGVDWTQIERVPEPGTENRWLYVWEEEQDAHAFCEEIRKETRDKGWRVRPLTETTAVSHGPLMPVVIQVTRQSHGRAFTLHPHSRSAILRRFPTARPVSSIYVEYITQNDFEQVNGPIWDHIALVLSGLSMEQLSELGGYRVFDLAIERTIFESTAPSAV